MKEINEIKYHVLVPELETYIKKHFHDPNLSSFLGKDVDGLYSMYSLFYNSRVENLESDEIIDFEERHKYYRLWNHTANKKNIKKYIMYIGSTERHIYFMEISGDFYTGFFQLNKSKLNLYKEGFDLIDTVIARKYSFVFYGYDFNLVNRLLNKNNSDDESLLKFS